MNITNHSINPSSESLSGKSPMDSPLRSTTPTTDSKLEESSSLQEKMKPSNSSQSSSTNVEKCQNQKITEKEKISTDGEFKVAGIEFRYSIKDGKRMINDMPAEEFIKTLNFRQLLSIVHVAVIKDSFK